ncbi:MAG TPA: AAA family ATPase, partial [Polyangiaceae bacterium]|nr:AAA family ATPase [Polyangiaceae bacterium]
WSEVCRILRDVASGLALLHARRVVHRDVSARNVWLTPDGRVKLIDFGTMAAFGKAADVAGTAPFLAPEQLHGPDIDQRTDLYSLGALGYWLLTGRHAFPARSLADLEPIWRERPRPPSRRVIDLQRDDLPEVPAALDALLGSLLSQDPLGRPTAAADVIDRLQVIASLEPDAHARVLESYLTSPAFVGRTGERGALRAALAEADGGKASRALVEGEPGLGRSRVLRELALEARLAGAAVLEAEAQRGVDAHGVARDLAMRLLAAVPAAARAAAAPYARTLGHLSPVLRERLGVQPADLAEIPHAHGEARMRVQAALRDWFLDVARHHTLVIVADNLEAFDEASAAWLAALAREAGAHRLMVVAALARHGGGESLAVQAFRQNLTPLVLRPFSLDETAALFRSVFGDVQHLGRFVDLVQVRAEGNPGHALDIAEHLGREGIIAFEDGVWVLPQSVPESALPGDRLGAEVARLARLPEHARRLGRALGLREGPIPLEMCLALADVDRRTLFDALEALVREGVLVGSSEGYRFARVSLRCALRDELDAATRTATHRRLGRFLLAAGGSELERLRAGVHLLLGGDEEEGSRAVALAGKHYGLVELADLAPAVPALEAALVHFRAAGRPAHEIASIIAPLALAGYYADRRLATQYGADAVETLQGILGLRLVPRLRPVLGRRLALLLALGVAAVGFVVRGRNPRIPTFREGMMLLFNCVAALTGVCTICIDPKGGKKYAAVLEPMTALGPDHVATFMYEFCQNLVATVEDRLGLARERWRRMIDRLERPDAVRDLPPHVHGLYLGGALYARGVSECWRDDSRALEFAERLEGLKLKLYDMSADQVRMMYYANRGDFEAFERYRARVEVHAIQRGTAWQVETWTHSGLITVYVRTQDAPGLKECAEQLKRLSLALPSLQFALMRATAAYLVVRGTPQEALELLGRDEEPLGLVGWGRGEGLRARAYNAVGDHARAKETCLAALALLEPEDLKFCALNLELQVELARAEAGLGNFGEAERQLRALLDTHGGAGNPLTVGSLHEALGELAAMSGDSEAFGSHLIEVDRWFRQTRNPALVARYEQLARDAVLAKMSPDGRPVTRSSSAPPPRLVTVVHKLRHGGAHTLSGSAEWALQQVTQLLRVEDGYIFLPADGEGVTLVASTGDAEAPTTLREWVAQRLRESTPEPGTMATATIEAPRDPNTLALGEKVFRVTLLRTAAEDGRDSAGDLVGAIVLSGDATLPFPVLLTIAERLHSTVTMTARQPRQASSPPAAATGTSRSLG